MSWTEDVCQEANSALCNCRTARARERRLQQEEEKRGNRSDVKEKMIEGDKVK